MDPFFQDLKTRNASEFPVQATTLLQAARIPFSPDPNEDKEDGIDSIETPGGEIDEQSTTRNLKKRVGTSRLKSHFFIPKTEFISLSSFPYCKMEDQ